MDAQAIAKMLVQKETPQPEGHAESHEDGEMDEGMEVAAEEMMAAMQSGDARSFATALKSFLGMC